MIALWNSLSDKIQHLGKIANHQKQDAANHHSQEHLATARHKKAQVCCPTRAFEIPPLPGAEER
jgi:hypothetical protein